MGSITGTIYALWLREVTRFLRSKARVLGAGGSPLLWLATFGVGIGSLITISKGTSYLDFIAPGIVGMTLLFSSIFAGVNVIWDKQFGFMKEMLVAPVPRAGIVLGKIAGSTTVSMISALVILVLVIAVGIIPLSQVTAIGVVLAIIMMLMISASFVSLGLIIASLINNIEGFQVIINFLILPVFFLSGALFPMNNVPLWLRGIAAIDPLQYGVDGMRGALIGISTYPVYMDLGIMLAIMAALVLIADIMFRRMQAK